MTGLFLLIIFDNCILTIRCARGLFFFKRGKYQKMTNSNKCGFMNFSNKYFRACISYVDYIYSTYISAFLSKNRKKTNQAASIGKLCRREAYFIWIFRGFKNTICPYKP